MHQLFFVDLMGKIPSRTKNRNFAPVSFEKFPNCKLVIDCTDIQIHIPKKMNLQRATYSSYRGYNSFKLLIGVAPNGVITFVSDLYPGAISDKNITLQSGILEQISEGDLILADKRF